MPELHSMGWYATRLAPRLPKRAFEPAPERLWGGLAYVLVAVGSALAIATLDLHWGLKALLALPIGLSMAGLGFLGHEILHGTVVRQPWLRDLLGGVCMSPFNLGTRLWRKWHNAAHHGHTQMDELDPDAFASMEAFYKRPLMRWLYRLPPWVRSLLTFGSFSLFFSVHSFLMLQKFYSEFSPAERRVVLAQFLVPAAFWLSLLFVVGPLNWLFIYLLPLLIANFIVICYISTNHQLNPHVDVNDPLASSLSVTVPRWIDMLHFNFSYHTEHHVFPAVNPKYGPLIKAEIRRLWPDRYHELPMGRALALLWKTPRLYANKTDLVDPHRRLAYGSLGHGLDPGNVQARPLETPQEAPKPQRKAVASS